MPTNVTWNGTSYNIPNSTELNWPLLSNFLIDLAGNAQTTNFQKFNLRKATVSPITVAAATDCVIVSDLAAPGAVAVNLPAGAAGQVFVIVDGKGDAATNNITITPNGSDTIQGAASLVINENNRAVILVFNGTDTNWTAVGRFLGSFTASRALQTNGTGDLEVSDVTAIELGYLDGVTSNVQTQLDAKTGIKLAKSISTNQTVLSTETLWVPYANIAAGITVTVNSGGNFLSAGSLTVNPTATLTSNGTTSVITVG